MTTETIKGRAYSLFSVEKAMEEGGKRTFSGIATTPTIDRMGDIVQPMGVKFKKQMPLLWQHRHDQPIGWVKFGKATKSGIPFDAEVAVIPEESNLKNRIDDAWLSIKHGLVPAVSIGFSADKYAWIDGGGIEFQEIECYELSAVTIPANPDAIITEVSNAKGPAEAAMILKAFDAGAPADQGRPERPTEITTEDAEATPGQKSADAEETAKRGHVAKLSRSAPAGAPFVINKIHRRRST